MEQDQDHEPNRNAIIGLALVALIVAVGLWLAREIKQSTDAEDCMMQSRANCESPVAQTR